MTPVGQTASINLIDKTSHGITQETLDAIVHALGVQAHEIALAWGSHVAHAFDHITRTGWQMVMMDDSDQAGALGYHDVTPDGLPYGRVFVNPVLANGGDWLHGPQGLSVSSVVSHEFAEMLGDAAANRWRNDQANNLWAEELCDAVESGAYDIDTPGGQVSVSDFLLPAYFDIGAPGPYSRLDTPTAPFDVTPGGYAIKAALHNETQVFGSELVVGDNYPGWKLAGKKHPAARTAIRLATFGTSALPTSLI